MVSSLGINLICNHIKIFDYFHKKRIGGQLKTLTNNKKEINLLLIQIIPAILTEFASNSSIASIFLPIIDNLVCILNNVIF
jgi:hypothetical protein